MPHLPIFNEPDVPRSRRGRIVWSDETSMGSAPAPRGSFPWMVSLFVLISGTGEALFMCAGTLLTPNIVSLFQCKVAQVESDHLMSADRLSPLPTASRTMTERKRGSPGSATTTFSTQTLKSRHSGSRKSSNMKSLTL
jgi:hypothetical protein